MNEQFVIQKSCTFGLFSAVVHIISTIPLFISEISFIGITVLIIVLLLHYLWHVVFDNTGVSCIRMTESLWQVQINGQWHNAKLLSAVVAFGFIGYTVFLMEQSKKIEIVLCSENVKGELLHRLRLRCLLGII